MMVNGGMKQWITGMLVGSYMGNPVGIRFFHSNYQSYWLLLKLMHGPWYLQFLGSSGPMSTPNFGKLPFGPTYFPESRGDNFSGSAVYSLGIEPSTFS